MKLLAFSLMATACQTAAAQSSSSGSLRLRLLQGDDEPTVQQKGLIDLVDLVAFDVDIVIQQDVVVEPFEITNLVTDWMNDAFSNLLEIFGYTEENNYAAFDTVILLDRQQSQRKLELVSQPDVRRRQLQASDTPMFFQDKARFKGAALFTRVPSSLSVPAGDVLAIQQLVLLNETGLLLALQASDARGLGDSALDVQAYLNPLGPAPQNSDSNQLELVIIVAIIVAAVAFLFLLLAICWAWRHDRHNRNAYLNAPAARKAATVTDRPDRTNSDSTMEETPGKREEVNPYPKEIGAFISNSSSNRYSSKYADAVLNEDINTSLSEYYRSGLGGQVMSSGTHARNVMNQDHNFNDAASISSMESYGYSLDGYAPSFATNPADGLVYAVPSSSQGIERVGDLPIEPAQETIRERMESEMAGIGSDEEEQEKPGRASPTEPESVSVEPYGTRSVTPSDEETNP